MLSYIRISEEDRDNAIRNLVTVVNSSGYAWNAVIPPVLFSGEGPEPVTLEEVKTWCKLDDDPTDDNLISALIPAARIVCEQYANLSFIPKTVKATIYNGLGEIRLPYGPVNGDVTSYKDEDGAVITDYKLSEAREGRITAEYNAGYSTLPDNLKIALLMQIAFMYQNRGDEKAASGVSEFAKLILKQVRDV